MNAAPIVTAMHRPQGLGHTSTEAFDILIIQKPEWVTILLSP